MCVCVRVFAQISTIKTSQQRTQNTNISYEIVYFEAVFGHRCLHSVCYSANSKYICSCSLHNCLILFYYLMLLLLLLSFACLRLCVSFSLCWFFFRHFFHHHHNTMYLIKGTHTIRSMCLILICFVAGMALGIHVRSFRFCVVARACSLCTNIVHSLFLFL